MYKLYCKKVKTITEILSQKNIVQLLFENHLEKLLKEN